MQLERRRDLANGRQGRFQAACRLGFDLPAQAKSDKSQGVRGTEAPDSINQTLKKTEKHVSVFSGEVQFLEVGNLALRQIHFQADRDGGLRRQLWGAAERNTLALANGARANAGFETITLKAARGVNLGGTKVDGNLDCRSSPRRRNIGETGGGSVFLSIS